MVFPDQVKNGARRLKEVGGQTLEAADQASQNFAEQEFQEDVDGVEFQVSRVGDRWQVTMFDGFGREVIDSYQNKGRAVSRARSMARRNRPSYLLVLKSDHSVDFDREYK